MSNQPKGLPLGDIVADVNYFPDLGTPISKSAWKTRYLGVGDDFTRSMHIHDVRIGDKTFKLDTHGFQFVTLQPRERVTGADDEETIRREYYPELEGLAKNLYSVHALVIQIGINCLYQNRCDHCIRFQSRRPSAQLAFRERHS